MTNNQQQLISNLEKLLQGKGAHASFSDAVAQLPAEMRGKTVPLIPYSIWQLVEHIRIAQWDMLEYCRNPSHSSPSWPDEYWPKETAPASPEHWQQSLDHIASDTGAFLQLLHSSDDICRLIPHADGQTLLQEALQIGDHTAYHTAEIIMLRRLLGCWQ